MTCSFGPFLNVTKHGARLPASSLAISEHAAIVASHAYPMFKSTCDICGSNVSRPAYYLYTNLLKGGKILKSLREVTLFHSLEVYNQILCLEQEEISHSNHVQPKLNMLGPHQLKEVFKLVALSVTCLGLQSLANFLPCFHCSMLLHQDSLNLQMNWQKLEDSWLRLTELNAREEVEGLNPKVVSELKEFVLGINELPEEDNTTKHSVLLDLLSSPEEFPSFCFIPLSELSHKKLIPILIEERGALVMSLQLYVHAKSPVCIFDEVLGKSFGITIQLQSQLMFSSH
ncbi:hypothetical protein VNO77_01942 [Canavalia gladiata]|uniref:Uncharacterized protein n=1 Tax=Canavalia gladiata TaxID=3824 RepID=A0AAN9R5G1_CANGL